MEDKNREDEEKQFKKLKFRWSNNTKFKSTYRKLYEENPDLMKGLPKETRIEPNRKRSTWKETFEKWRKEKK